LAGSKRKPYYVTGDARVHNINEISVLSYGNGFAAAAWSYVNQEHGNLLAAGVYCRQEQALFGHGERALSGSVTPPLSRPRLRSVAALPVKSHPHFVYKRFAAAESRFVTLMEVKLPPPVNTVRKVAVGVGWALSAERHALPQSSAEVSVCDSSAQARLSFPHLCASARDSGELRSARKYFFIQRTHGA